MRAAEGAPTRHIDRRPWADCAGAIDSQVVINGAPAIHMSDSADCSQKQTSSDTRSLDVCWSEFLEPESRVVSYQVMLIDKESAPPHPPPVPASVSLETRPRCPGCFLCFSSTQNVNIAVLM